MFTIPSGEKVPHFPFTHLLLLCKSCHEARSSSLCRSRTFSFYDISVITLSAGGKPSNSFSSSTAALSFKVAANAGPNKLNKEEESVGGIDLINFPQRRLHIIRFPTSVLVTPSHHRPIIQDCRIRGMWGRSYQLLLKKAASISFESPSTTF